MLLVNLSQFSLILLTPAIFNFDRKMAGAFEVVIEGFLYHVALERKGVNVCSGAIFTERHILSAANCFNEDGRVYVRYGSGAMLKGGDRIPVVRVEKHPFYNKCFHSYDIAVVFVEGFQNSVSFVEVPIYTDSTYNYTHGWVTGWGLVNNSERAEKLQVDLMYPVDHKTCKKIWGLSLTEEIFCFTSKNNNPCQGDSGGPLVHQGILIGIVSRGALPCGTHEMPTIFTKLNKFRYWIWKLAEEQGIGHKGASSSAATKIKPFL